MKTGFFRNLIGHFWLIFAALGIAFTLYATFWLIPRYLRGENDALTTEMNKHLIQQVQENIIKGKKTHVIQLQTMIEGESLQKNVKYPYTVEELLIQTESNIYQNNFLPDSTKARLEDKIQQLKTEWSRYIAGLPDEHKPSTQPDLWKKYSKGIYLKIILINILGIMLTLIGLYSIYVQFKGNHKQFLERLFKEKQMAMEEQIKVNLWYEQILEKALTGLKMKYKVLLNKHSKADLHLKTESGQQVFIKSRYIAGHSSIDIEFTNRFIHTINVNKAFGIFITNKDDKETSKLLEQHNQDNPNLKIFMIVGDTVDELKGMIMNTVNRIDKKES